ncbi:MAG: SsrA-binding protein SmpB [Sphingomonadales bacterium]
MARRKRAGRGPAGSTIVAENRKARHNFLIEDVYEAGIVLSGTEVKSLRAGQANIADAYAEVKEGEVHLVNAHFPEYLQANRFNHHPRRPRKLLLHKREINKLAGATQRAGMTLVPLTLYFNEKGRAKIEIATARGKKLYDKRASDKDRSWKRDKERLMRDRG